jgi:hypothetical protein
MKPSRMKTVNRIILGLTVAAALAVGYLLIRSLKLIMTNN